MVSKWFVRQAEGWKDGQSLCFGGTIKGNIMGMSRFHFLDIIGDDV